MNSDNGDEMGPSWTNKSVREGFCSHLFAQPDGVWCVVREGGPSSDIGVTLGDSGIDWVESVGLRLVEKSWQSSRHIGKMSEWEISR